MSDKNKVNQNTTNQNEQEGKETNTLQVESEVLKKGFTIIPNYVLRATNLSRDAKLLYGILLSYAWQTDSCFPGYETLQRDLQCGSAQVNKYIKELKEAGLIDVKRRGQGLTSIYTIKDVAPENSLFFQNERTRSSEMKEQEVSERKSNNTQSKNTQIKNTKSFRKANALETEKEKKDEKETHSHKKPTATRNQNTRGGSGTAHKPNGKVNTAAKQPVYIGKPLTQDEIDEKKKNGQNASGFTPIAGIIPASHWQELKASFHPSTNGNGNENSNGNLHYHHTTKNAPLSIDATIEQLSTLLHYEPENTVQNINRAAKLCKLVGYDSDQFANLLWSIYHEIKKKPDKLFKTRRADGRANKMPVFFAELEKALGLKPKQPN